MPHLVDAQAVVVPHAFFIDVKRMGIPLPPPLELYIKDARRVDGNSVVEEGFAADPQEHGVALGRPRGRHLRREMLREEQHDKKE